jgi:hypothetical protein
LTTRLTTSTADDKLCTACAKMLNTNKNGKRGWLRRMHNERNPFVFFRYIMERSIGKDLWDSISAPPVDLSTAVEKVVQQQQKLLLDHSNFNRDQNKSLKIWSSFFDPKKNFSLRCLSASYLEAFLENNNVNLQKFAYRVVQAPQSSKVGLLTLITKSSRFHSLKSKLIYQILKIALLNNYTSLLNALKQSGRLEKLPSDYFNTLAVDLTHEKNHIFIFGTSWMISNNYMKNLSPQVTKAVSAHTIKIISPKDKTRLFEKFQQSRKPSNLPSPSTSNYKYYQSLLS